jgi:multidrug transporter EmrE-like cation transporter
MKDNKFIEWYGWCGMILIILAYVLVSFYVIEVSNVWYQILNGVGALGIVLVSFYKKNYQPAVLNIIWTVVAVIAILKIFF